MKLDQNILAILSAIETDGDRAVIAEKLDRKVYLQVNQILEAAGGLWNKRAKAHLFGSGSAAEAIDAVIAAGEVKTTRELQRELGFFETPPGLAQTLVRLAGIMDGHFCLEPSAGTGQLVEAMLGHGAYVDAIEYDPTLRRKLVDRFWASPCVNIGASGQQLDSYDDFLVSYDAGPHYHRVVMNPPFCKSGLGDHLDHVMHAYDFLLPGGVLVAVLPAGVKFRRDKRHRAFRAWGVDHGAEIADLPEGSFTESGTGVSTVVLRVVKL